MSHGANIKEKKRTAWYNATCASCGFTANALVNGQIRSLPSVVMQLVDKVSNLEETMLQLKEINAELIKLVKAQCNANDTIRDKNCALVEEVARLRNEINHGNEIRAMNDKLDKHSSDLTNLSQAPTERESYAAVTSRNRWPYTQHLGLPQRIYKLLSSGVRCVKRLTNSLLFVAR